MASQQFPRLSGQGHLRVLWLSILFLARGWLLLEVVCVTIQVPTTLGSTEQSFLYYLSELAIVLVLAGGPGIPIALCNAHYYKKVSKKCSPAPILVFFGKCVLMHLQSKQIFK